MRIVERLLGGRSLNEVRVSNFTKCVAESPGTNLVNEDGGTLTIRINPQTTASDDFIRLLNSSRVTIRELYTDDGSSHLVVNVN